MGCPEKSCAVFSFTAAAAASAAHPDASFLPVSAARRADAVAQASSPPGAYAAAADARSAQNSAAGADPRCAMAVALDGSAAGALAPNEYSAQYGSVAPRGSVPADSPRAGCLLAEADSVPHGSADNLAAPKVDDRSVPVVHSAGSAPDDCSRPVGSAVTVPAGCSAVPRAGGHSLLVVGSAGSVPDDCSPAVGSAATVPGCLAAPMADDHSLLVVGSADLVPDDCSPAADLVPAGLVDCLAAPGSSQDAHSLPAGFLDGFLADLVAAG
jgi:hypothetical protein